MKSFKAKSFIRYGKLYHSGVGSIKVKLNDAERAIEIAEQDLICQAIQTFDEVMEALRGQVPDETIEYLKEKFKKQITD